MNTGAERQVCWQTAKARVAGVRSCACSLLLCPCLFFLFVSLGASRRFGSHVSGALELRSLHKRSVPYEQWLTDTSRGHQRHACTSPLLSPAYCPSTCSPPHSKVDAKISFQQSCKSQDFSSAPSLRLSSSCNAWAVLTLVGTASTDISSSDCIDTLRCLQ